MGLTYQDIEYAIDLADVDDILCDAYIDLNSGKVYVVSDVYDFEEPPDDLYDEDRYLQVPRKRDLVHGRSLIRSFIREFAPNLTHEVNEIFSRRGAYRRYKDFLRRVNLIDQWHDYEQQHEKEAILAWCQENNLKLSSNDE